MGGNGNITFKTLMDASGKKDTLSASARLYRSALPHFTAFLFLPPHIKTKSFEARPYFVLT